jgi:hypothetical protein
MNQKFKGNWMKRKPIKSALKNTSLVILFASIISEGVGILILYQTKTPHSNLVLIDSLLLVILLIPILYFFVYRPLNADMNEIDRLNREKDSKIVELNTALSEIKTLRGIIPICASCKKIRDNKENWKQIELYIKEHSDAVFSHGICPECAEKLYPEYNPYNKNKPHNK